MLETQVWNITSAAQTFYLRYFVFHSPKLFPKHVLQSYQAEYQGNYSLSPFKKELLCVGGHGCLLRCSVLRHREMCIQLSSAWHFWDQVLSTRIFPLTILAAVPVCRKKRQDSKGQRQSGNERGCPCNQEMSAFLVGQKRCILVCVAKTTQTLCMKRH